MAKWVKKQTDRIKTIVAGAIDLENRLSDAICNMTAASSLDLIYMTAEQDEQPYVARPYVWDLVRFIQRKLIKIKKHSSLNGLDSETLARRVASNLQNSVTKELYSLIKDKKMSTAGNPIQLLFEFKFLTMTVLKE